jgi:aerobic-type carbon monoxide dehydrogenase small subunit (CoxS/CutS family)
LKKNNQAVQSMLATTPGSVNRIHPGVLQPHQNWLEHVAWVTFAGAPVTGVWVYPNEQSPRSGQYGGGNQGDHMPNYKLNVDGAVRAVNAEKDEPLLYALTDALKLKGPKFGCGVAQCGTCTVLVNGQPMRSCVLPTASVGNKPIRTLDGLEKNGQLHPVQAAFVEEQAAQCGYCANGWVMHAVALLEKNPKATDAQIQQGLANVQCRCGTQIAILRAVKKARDNMATAKA